MLAVASTLGFAQQQAGEASLTVTVVDYNKDILPSAQVILQGAENFRQTLLTDQRGEAAFAKLPSGKYRLRAEAEHFEPREQAITLKTGSRRITIRLEVAQLKEEIVVRQSERERRTDSRSDTFTTILTEEQIANLPDDPDEMKAALERMAGPGAVFQVDGFAGGRIPPKSQIRQIRFRRNSFAAEYHQAGVVVVEILTKPSAGALHGSFGYGFRNQTFNARNAFAPFRAPEGLQRFEASLDVPVRPSRTSLFLAGNSNQAYDSTTIVAALPTGALNDVARQPSRDLYVSARVNNTLSKSHDLKVNFFRTGSRRDNLGVGNFSLTERAFSSSSADHRFQVSESGAVGSKVFHEFRLQLHWQNVSLRPVNDARGLIVLGAFNGGGTQARSDRGLAEMEARENVDFAWNQHAMRAGIMFEAGNYRNLNLNNQNGTFTFSSLFDFLAGTPSTFSQRVSIRPVDFSYLQLGAYWQDDWRVVPSLTLSYGVRYERQNNLHDSNNYAPRFGFGWSPFKNGRTTIRGGLGVFFDWHTAATVSDLLSEDGQRGTSLVIRNPGFPDPFSGGSRIVLPPGRSQSSEDLRNPSILQAALDVQRQLPLGMSMIANYSYQQGFHLFRGRNINAPILGVGRPFPDAGNLIQLESTARSFSHILNLTLNSGANRRLSWMASYSLLKKINEADGPLSLPADNFDLRGELGPASDDRRHRVIITTGIGLFKGWRVSPTFFYTSALPYNVTTGRDDNGDTTFNDRPPELTRNGARGADTWDVDMRLSWLFGFGKADETARTGSSTVVVQAGDYGAIGGQLGALQKKWRFNYYIQATNLFNNFNPINFVGVMTSPFFGRPTAAAPARKIETGLRFSF
ncbi:MAG: TonB-dependent receptor [Acidobacteria bacterium]|nr:TonB-dependent receptor [Acidobacteriota bacterium]